MNAWVGALGGKPDFSDVWAKILDTVNVAEKTC
jgi:hypothetical protein